MNAVQLSLDQALAGRDLGLDQLEGHYPRWLDRARVVAEEICRRRGTVTADDIREVLPIPEGVHPNTMGAVFRNSQFEFVGWERSAQPQRHANRIGRWRLRNGESEDRRC